MLNFVDSPPYCGFSASSYFTYFHRKPTLGLAAFNSPIITNGGTGIIFRSSQRYVVGALFAVPAYDEDAKRKGIRLESFSWEEGGVSSAPFGPIPSIQGRWSTEAATVSRPIRDAAKQITKLLYTANHPYRTCSALIHYDSRPRPASALLPSNAQSSHDRYTHLLRSQIRKPCPATHDVL